MPTYKCDICGKIETAKTKLSAEILDFDFCCRECDNLFIKAAEATDINDLDRQLCMIIELIEEGKIPEDVSKLINRVVKYQTAMFLDETDRSTLEEIEDKLDKEIRNHERIKKQYISYTKNNITYSTSAMINQLHIALDNAIDNEFYEAADKINKRLKELQKS
jgi:hypothetical protein|tara:strand:+ start:8534 stop:9022 length:489 start_codon:yes stop_codon:yes gene_type:complete